MLQGHVHPSRDFIQTALGDEARYWFEMSVWELDYFQDTWTYLHEPTLVNGFRYNKDDYDKATPVVDWGGAFQYHGLVVRLSPYPLPVPLGFLVKVPWLGDWANRVFQTYKYMQRELAATRVFDYLERAGALAADAPLPPDEYSIQALEDEVGKYVFINAWTVDNRGDGLWR
ncbi:hypothetical protein V8F33_011074 [Rhypophila sp. PSN 637]